MPWPYSWEITPASRSLSRFGGIADGSRLSSVTFRPVRLASSVSPSTLRIITDGMFTWAVPPIVNGLPSVFWTTMTATAPAASAFWTLTAKLQRPRSTSATSAVIGPTADSCGPNAAALAASSWPAMAGGALTSTTFGNGYVHSNICIRGSLPSGGVSFGLSPGIAKTLYEPSDAT
jgi:hypothetical protein